MTKPYVPDQSLGDRLRTYREQAGLTQADVSRELGITAQAYSHYETGRRSPSPDTFFKIAQLYHVSMECLLTNRKNSSDYLFYKISNLPVEDRQNVEHFISFLHSRHPVSSQNSKHNK